MQILLLITASQILCILKLTGCALGFIVFFQLRKYKKLFKQHIKNDIEAKEIQAKVNDAIEKFITKE